MLGGMEGCVTDRVRDRRPSRWLLWTAVACVLVVLAAVVPSPYAIERPGPVVNTLGDVTLGDETGPVVTIDGAETYPTAGALNLLTVTIVGSNEHPSSWLSLVPALFDRSQRVVPIAELYPEEMTDSDRENMNSALMNSSQIDATAAVLAELGTPAPATLRVAGIAEDGPADGVLQEGDILVSADGIAVDHYEQLRAIIAESGSGNELMLEVKRDGQLHTETVVPEEFDGADGPLIGVGVATDYELPIDVDISLEEIGGPSAGMMFALAIHDLLTPGELTEGMHVSGTGTISGTGAVGEIGGLEQKLWGAARADSALFLMPVENCADLPERLPAGDMHIAPVATLGEAIDAVETAAAGGTPPGIEVCEAG